MRSGSFWEGVKKVQQEKCRLFTGPFGILPTPFLENGQVDYGQIERMADRLCQSELSGIVVCGSTSEFVFLSAEENQEIMRVASRAVAGRKKLVCGATAADARTTLGYLEWMAGQGADGALIAPPYYFRYDGGDVLAFYRKLSQARFPVPIVAYQIPAFSSPIPLDRMEELMGLEGIFGLKNSSADIKQIMHQVNLRNLVCPSFSVLTGTDDALVPCLAGGCDGSFTAVAAVLPEEICGIYAAMRENRLEEANRLQNDLLPLIRLADRLPFPVGYKVMAEEAGILHTSYRQETSPVNRELIVQIRKEMRLWMQNRAYKNDRMPWKEGMKIAAD